MAQVWFHCGVPVWKSLFHHTVPDRFTFWKRPRMRLSFSLCRVHFAFSLYPTQRCYRPLLYIPDLMPSYHASSSHPSFIWYVAICSLLMGLDEPRWCQLWKYNPCGPELSWVLKSCMFHVIPHWFVRTPSLLGRILLQMKWQELQCWRIHCQHLLTNQMKHRLNFQIRSCKTNLFQTWFIFLKWTETKELYSLITEYF